MGYLLYLMFRCDRRCDGCDEKFGNLVGTKHTLRSCIGLSVNAWMCMCLLYVLRGACGCMRWLHGVCHLFQESKSYVTADFKYNNIYSLGIE